MKRTLIKDTINYIGKEVRICGWVRVRRDHGKLIFFDVVDMSGEIQAVVLPNHKEAHEIAKKIRSEFVLELVGKINARPKNAVNKDVPTGILELEVAEIKVLNESETPPFELEKDTSKVSEEIRLRYRYLDLRTDRMKRNIIMRSRIVQFIRNFYIQNGFLEIETPFLTKGTPEGAREFLVPSRLHKEKFYVLPQSPQQFKQLLMVAGFERYFQIVKCFRDEDQRGDRQPEFTQLDVEMSFCDEIEIRAIFEKCLLELIKENFPEKKIAAVPFPVITHAEAMKKYQTDKPDLRQNKNDADELAFCWVNDFPLFEKARDGSLTSSHHPFTSPKDEDLELLENSPEKVRAKAYDIVLNGYEIGGGSIRIYKKELQRKIFEILGVRDNEIDKRFGHMLRAFEFGAPPHGGIAPGIDRIAMLLLGEPNIREVMAFPKTGEAEDLMMDAPSKLGERELREVGIEKIIYTKD